MFVLLLGLIILCILFAILYRVQNPPRTINVFEQKVQDLDEGWKQDSICFYITLDEKSERAQKSVNSINKMGLQPSAFMGTVGKKLSKDGLINNNIIEPDCQLGMGEIGCFLSHIRLWRHCKLKYPKHKYYIIFEDDAICDTKYCSKILNLAMNKIQDMEIDVLYLGHCFPRTVPMKSSVTKLLNKFRIERKSSLCTHAMVITEKGLDKLIKYIADKPNPIGKKPIDIVIQNLALEKKLNTYNIEPQICKQDQWQTGDITFAEYKKGRRQTMTKRFPKLMNLLSK